MINEDCIVEPKIEKLDHPERFYLVTDDNEIALSFGIDDTHGYAVFRHIINAEEFLHRSDIDSYRYRYIISATLNAGVDVIYMDFRCVREEHGRFHIVDLNKEARLKSKDLKYEDEVHYHQVIYDSLSEEYRFDPVVRYYADYHTHGLCNYGHLELQMVLLIDPNARNIFWSIVDLVKLGLKFKAGDRIGEKLAFMEFPDHTTPGLSVLRIVFCDPNGKFPWEDECDESYKLQMEDLWK